MSTENLIRITVFANRNPKISEEEYHKHWVEKHAPLVSSWLQRHGIVRYTQYHTTTAHKNLASQDTLSYDGMADFYVKKYEDFEKAYDDPYYKDVVKPDEEYLFDIQKMRVMVGTETCVIEEGQIVKGRDQFRPAYAFAETTWKPLSLENMSDAWFSSKIAPNGDVNGYEGGCHFEEAHALKAYLRRETTPTEAAQAITRPISIAVNPEDELHHLWALVYDALIELPQEHIAPLIDLLQAIENLDNPAAIPNDSGHPDDRFWKESPGFGNLWADMSPTYCWRAIAKSTEGERHDNMRVDHVRRAQVEAKLVDAGLAGITIHWGYNVVADALESNDAIMDFETLAAVEWLVVCGKQFKEGAKKRQQSWGLKEGIREPLRDLWKVKDDEVMTLERWEFWRERLRKFQVESVLVKDVRRALQAMEEEDQKEL